MVEAAVKGKPGAKGLAVIITNDYSTNPNVIDLPGTVCDGKALSSALTALNFAVCWEQNVREDQLGKIIREMSNLKHTNVKNYRCIFFIFSGHGSKDDCLIMEDNKSLNLHEKIISPLLPGKAKRIGNIQKVFLIDACRGELETSTTSVPRSSIIMNLERIQLPKEGGFLVAYATMPSHSTYETPGCGGVWLSRVARLLDERAYLDSFESLLTKVNEILLSELQDKKSQLQQPERFSRLNKIINLEPGNVT